jgi:hypothetical protein
LRLLGVLGERKPSLGHFDEKGLMLRTAGCLRHPRFANMMNEGVAVAPVLFPFTGLHLLEFKVHDWGSPSGFPRSQLRDIGTFPVSLLSRIGSFRSIAASDLLSLTTPAEVHHSSMNPVELRPPAIHP